MDNASVPPHVVTNVYRTRLKKFITDSSMASGVPTDRIILCSLRSGLKSFFSKRTNMPFPVMYQCRPMAHETANAMQVAQAAPATPMSRP